jgi:hypothetical protein
MPYDGDEVTEQQNKRGTDIKQKELHKSPAPSSHFRQRTLVASSRTYIHPTTYITCTFSKMGNGYSWGWQNRNSQARHSGAARAWLALW